MTDYMRKFIIKSIEAGIAKKESEIEYCIDQIDFSKTRIACHENDIQNEKQHIAKQELQKANFESEKRELEAALSNLKGENK